MTDEERKAEEQKQKDLEAQRLANKDKPVTQAEVDKWFKQTKLTEEKLDKALKQLETSENSNVNLVNRVAALETPAEKPFEQPPAAKNYGRQVNGTVVFPQTAEEWDELATDNPTLHADLRYTWNSQSQGVQNEFINSAIKVSEKHPDMYQKDGSDKVKISDGTVKVGDTVIPKGCPIVDIESDKFKIYMGIIEKNGFDIDGQPIILKAKRGPELVMAAMENEISQKGMDTLKDKATEEKRIADAKREADAKAGKTAPPGQAPPSQPKIEVKFNSDFERKSAEAGVARGTYKDLEEYCRVRDNPVIPYNRGV